MYHFLGVPFAFANVRLSALAFLYTKSIKRAQTNAFILNAKCIKNLRILAK